MDLGIEDRVALVTGSSRGLGFATAERLAREGARVVITGRDPASLDAARLRIEALRAGPCLAVAGTVTDQDARAALVAAAQSAFGPIEIAVLNTGGPPTGTFDSLGAGAWDDAYGDVLKPIVELARLVLPGMREKGWGRLLAVTSFVAKAPADTLLLSNSLRSAVVGLMRSLANEYGRHGITANSILPGYTLTERLRNVAGAMAQQTGVEPDRAFAAIEAQVPLARLGAPEEFADAAAFLVSDCASYITGTALLVDGGLVRTSY